MITTIAKHEFLSNVKTFRFIVVFVVAIVLIGLSAHILTRDYVDRLQDYRAAVREHKGELEKVRVYSMLRPKIDRPPSVLSIFCKGIEDRVGTTVEISHRHVPVELTGEAARENPYLKIFPSIDMSWVIAVFFGLLALLLSYDSISGEKERGTLGLMLSNAVPRHRVILGKYLGGIFTLFFALVVSFIFGFLVIKMHPLVTFTKDDILRILLILLISLIYVSAFYLISAFISSRTKSSAISLILCLFTWIFLVIIFPNLSMYIAQRIRPIESKAVVDEQVKALEDERREKVKEFHDKIIPARGIAYWGASVDWDRGIFRIEGATRSTFEYHRKLAQFEEPLSIEYADKIGSTYHDYYRKLEGQARLGEQISSISPLSLYLGAVSSISNTDAKTYDKFMKEAKGYRRQLISYLQTKNTFGSYRWFCNIGEKGMVPDEVWGSLTHERARELLNKWRADSKPLNLSDMPRFNFNFPSVGEGLKTSLISIGLLVFVNILFFTLTFVSFLRYDVR